MSTRSRSHTIALVQPGNASLISPRDWSRLVEAIRRQVKELEQYWQQVGSVEVADVTEHQAVASLQRGDQLVIFDDFSEEAKPLAPERLIGMGIHFHAESGPPKVGPHALVHVSREDANKEWTVTASHECLELLLDPSDETTVGGSSPVYERQIHWEPHVKRPKLGPEVDFYREICDPVQATANTYEIGGINVSDFVTPAFYEANATEQLDAKGVLSHPLSCPPGGFLSWKERAGFGDPEYESLGLWNDNGTLHLVGLGKKRCLTLGTVHLSSGGVSA